VARSTNEGRMNTMFRTGLANRTLMLLVLAAMLGGCMRRRKWDSDANTSACPTRGTAYSYYFADAPEGRFQKEFPSPKEAAAAAEADGCKVQRVLVASVVACCD
jgi:hypothetical protein